MIGRLWVGPAVAGLVAALVVLACAWPALLAPGEHIIGASQADFYGIAFGMDHIAQHLFAGGWPPAHTKAIEYPAGAILVVTDLPEMVLLAPITWLFGPAVAFNLLQLLHHALAAAAAWWCARVLGLAPSGRAVAALAFAFAPALVGTTFNQNPDATALYWVPLAAGFAGSATGWRRAAVAGLCAGLAVWFTPYGGVMAGVAVLLLLPGRDWRRWLAALGVMVLVGGAGALVAWWSVKDPFSAVYKPGAAVALHGSAHLEELLLPRPMVHTNLEWSASQFVHDGYLGWSLVLAGVVGAAWARRWRWLLLAVLGVFMALGPLLAGEHQTQLRNPVWSIGNRLGMVRLWQYHRYTALVVLALGLGAGWLAGRLGRWGWLLLPVVALDLLGVTGAWQRLGTVPVFDDGSCALLEPLPEGPVYDIPPGGHELWMYNATCHGNPVASGINRPDSRYVRALLKHAVGPSAAEHLALLRDIGFRYLVYHPTAPNSEKLDPMIPFAAPCVVAENALGVKVMDLQTCPIEFPELGPLPPPRDPKDQDLRSP